MIRNLIHLCLAVALVAFAPLFANAAAEFDIQVATTVPVVPATADTGVIWDDCDCVNKLDRHDE